MQDFSITTDQLAEENRPPAKTRAATAQRQAFEQQERMRRAREAAKNKLRAIDQSPILPAARAAAESKLKQEFGEIWFRFTPSRREQLIRINALGAA